MSPTYWWVSRSRVLSPSPSRLSNRRACAVSFWSDRSYPVPASSSNGWHPAFASCQHTKGLAGSQIFFLLGRFANPALRQQVADAMAQVPAEVIRVRLREIAICDVSAEVSKVRVPILYLRASDDRLVPRWCGERIASLSPRVNIVEISAPHLLLQCAPRESAVAISRFARECSPPLDATAP